jgi:hypothetical protein
MIYSFTLLRVPASKEWALYLSGRNQWATK